MQCHTVYHQWVRSREGFGCFRRTQNHDLNNDVVSYLLSTRNHDLVNVVGHSNLQPPNVTMPTSSSS